MTIREKLSLLEQLSGGTQTKLAESLHVSFVTYNRWRSGKAIPRKDAEKRIDRALATFGFVPDTTATVSVAKKTIITTKQISEKKLLTHILKRPDLLDELSLHVAYNSNAIEGSTLSLGETARIIFKKETIPNKTLVEQLEARNHDRALRFVLAELKNGVPVSESLLCATHRILLSGIRDDAGRYRTHPVRIVGSFVPTANHLRVPELVRSLFARKLGGDTVARVAIFHADFEKIHPFSDGNGRVGRLLLLAQLLKYNIAPAIIPQKKRKAYYSSLQKAQLDGDYEQLEEYICDAILAGYHLLADQ